MNRKRPSGRLPAFAEMIRIGQGRTTEIFAWEDGRALRLFRDGASRDYARHEMQVSRSIHQVGIPSPAVHPTDSEDGLVEIDGRFGFVMDRVDGPSMLQALTARPWRLWRYARSFARLHRTMHVGVARQLPSQYERFHHVIDRISDTVGPKVADRIRSAIDEVWEGDVVCHGDFHPDNVLMSDRGPIIIDWGPATSGCPAADVAWTVYLFRHGGTPPAMRPLQRLVLTLFRGLFLSVYRRVYLQGSPVEWSEVERWGPAIAAIRLGDGIPEERELLLRIIHKGFGDSADR